MSFNYEKDGLKIAVINSEKRQKKVYFSDNDEGYENIHLKDGQSFMLSPDKATERITMYVCGSSGSGKSYFISEYISEYHKIYKNNAVYLFSENDSDKAFDQKEYIQRVDLTGMDIDPLDWKEFQNCMVIFDDIDSISNKKLSMNINNLRDSLLKNARKYAVSVISSSHDACSGKSTKSVLNESQIIVFFMLNYNKSMHYLMHEYLGMSKDIIEKLRKHTKSSRWTAFVKSYPSYIIQQKMISTIPKLEHN